MINSFGNQTVTVTTWMYIHSTNIIPTVHKLWTNSKFPQAGLQDTGKVVAMLK